MSGVSGQTPKQKNTFKSDYVGATLASEDNNP